MHEILARLYEAVFKDCWHTECLKGHVFFSEIKFRRESCSTRVNSPPSWRALELEVLYVGYTASLFEKINA